jgi:hypothetical protein
MSRPIRIPAAALFLLCPSLALCSKPGPEKNQGGETMTRFVAPGYKTAEAALRNKAADASSSDEIPAVEDPVMEEAAALAVPPENQAGGQKPDPMLAEAMVRRLFDAIVADDPSLAANAFFPADAFDLVKAMDEPGRYHKKLTAWFNEDIHLEHDQYPDTAGLEYAGFEPGKCKWMEIHTEGNKLPYWACRYNAFYGKKDDIKRKFELRVMINWGSSWYVTHLGASR